MSSERQHAKSSKSRSRNPGSGGSSLSRGSSLDSASSSASSRSAPAKSAPAASASASASASPSCRPNEVTKVTILGAGGGIGQPLAMLLMLHSELVQHVAMHDLVDSIHGVGLDVSHIDRRCKITTHLGPDALVEAVRGAKVIVIPAGLAQKPGMSRDDLFASNAKIMFNLARVCAQTAPQAMLAIITNPVNSLVPVVCEVYSHHLGTKSSTCGPDNLEASTKSSGGGGGRTKSATGEQSLALKSTRSEGGAKPKFQDCYRRIFGVTTLDVVRASTLTAKSGFFKSEPNGMFKDPSLVKVPVVGGHAGKTIMPLLSQAYPRLDRKRLADERNNTMTLVESIQNAGIEVLNAKKGRGSATIAMAYAACRFTLSLLRALMGEQNIVECAYVHQPSPVFRDLDYFATPLLLGKEGFVRSLGIPGCCQASSAATAASKSCDKQNTETAILPFEQQMLEEGARELRFSIARGEDFAKEHLSSER